MEDVIKQLISKKFSEENTLVNAIFDKLKNTFHKNDFYFHNTDATSFDVIIKTDVQLLPSLCADAIGCEIVSQAEGVVSFNIPQCQTHLKLNLIQVKSECFDFACNFYSHNEIGALINLVARKVGFCITHHGLMYPVRDVVSTNRVYDTITITRTWNDAIQLLGFNVEAYEQGVISSPDDIFEFIATSKYFNREQFMLDVKNAKSRAHGAKRIMYANFLSWLEMAGREGLSNFDWSQSAGVRTQLLKNTLRLFPEFAANFGVTMKSLNTLLMLRQKINLELVSSVTGRTDGDLDLLLREAQCRFVDQDAMFDWFSAADNLALEEFFTALKIEPKLR